MLRHCYELFNLSTKNKCLRILDIEIRSLAVTLIRNMDIFEWRAGQCGQFLNFLILKAFLISISDFPEKNYRNFSFKMKENTNETFRVYDV